MVMKDAARPIMQKNKEISKNKFIRKIIRVTSMEPGMGALWEVPQKERRAGIAEPMKEIVETPG